MRRFLPLLLAAGLALCVLVVALIVRSMEPQGPGSDARSISTTDLGTTDVHGEALEAPDAESGHTTRTDGTQPRIEPQYPVPPGHARIRLHVIERGTGRPLADALVGLYPDPSISRTQTDVRGDAELLVEFGPHPVALVVTHVGHSEGQPLVVLEEAGDHAFTIELDRNVALVGRIVGREHQGVAGADVLLGAKTTWGTPGLELRELGTGKTGTCWVDAKSGADGRFRFEDVERRATLTLRVRAADARCALVELGAVNAEADIDVGDVVLGDPLVLRGSVVRVWKGEPDGPSEPLAGIQVDLREEQTGRFFVKDARNAAPIERSSTTDSSGVFAFEGLMPGDYRVFARMLKDGSPIEISAERPDARSAGKQLLPYAFVELRSADAPPARILATRTTRLRGRVVDPEQRAAVGATVEATGAAGSGRARTDADGRFEIFGLGRARVRVSAWPNGVGELTRATIVEDAVPGGLELLIVLDSAEFVEGRVVDEGLRPVEFAGVTAFSPAGAELDFTYTDAEGRFRLRVPHGEAVDLETCPSRMKDEKTRTLDLQSDLRAETRGVRANAGPVELRLAPRR